MKRSIVTFFLFLLCGLTLAQKELSFEFDYAKFNNDSTSILLEFYYDLNPKDMYKIQTDAGFSIEAIVQIEMKNLDTDQYFINKSWKIQNVISDSLTKSLSGVLAFVVPEGNYSLTVKAYDAKNPTLSKTVKDQFLVRPFKNDKYSISNIQLASQIKKEDADANSLFYKNTLEVIPNPSMFFSEQSPVLYYYAELYNLILADEKTEFTLQKLLFNSAGVQVYKTSKKLKQGKKAVVDYGAVPLAKYPTDSYNLVLSLIDTKTNQAVLSSKRFYLYNPSIIDSSLASKVHAGLLGSEFSVYTLEECDKMFSQVKYISTKKEIDQYGKIDSLSGKREFLYNFWKNRESNSLGQANEFKKDYMRRAAFANQNFKVGLKEGYLTDRGRVLLSFGDPDQRDFFPSESHLKPYEVWFYNSIEGGISFIFGDLTGFGNYELLHSTKRGEIKDENWIRRLATE